MYTDDAGTLAQGGVKLEAVAFRDDKTRGVILGRAETARQIADLLGQTEAREEVGSLVDIAKFWAKRADEIEAAPPAGKHPAAVLAIVATLRREAKFLDEFLAALYGSASA